MLTPTVIEKYGLKVGNDIIEIPIKDPQGNYLFSKYRVFNKPMKYLYEKGSQMALFNADSITNLTTDIYIVEGEFDAIALQSFFNDARHAMYQYTNIAVVSSTGGAGSWNLEWNELIANKRVTILLDNDIAGRKGSTKLWENIRDSVIYKVKDQYKDVCEMVNNSNGNFHVHGIFTIPYINITSLKAINDTLSLLDENDLQDGSNKEFNDLMRSKLSEMYQKKKFENKRKVTLSDDKIQDMDIALLKTIPIASFVHFKNGVAPCIFHNDHTPSMHYNNAASKLPNTVKCYACGKFADVIDIIIQLENVDFKGALEYLRNYQ